MTTSTNSGTDSARHMLKAVDAHNGRRSPAVGDLHQDRSSGVPAGTAKVVFFLVGCALLVGCAFAIDKLGQWSADYGQVWVFLGFFLVMSLGGRWFWSGADAGLGWVKYRIRS